MIRTQISMTEEQAVRLRALATARQRSQAAMLREALDDLLDAEDRTDRLRRARAAVGGFRSGHTDTADQHDEVLVEAYDHR